ncbi:hypothetical protein NQ176_g3803 [Zarea fungicola]|uniref:Uncharacterized protein n=1 Tax=Zarea fungicola TaxID=93591 RepID=A0ACC1NJE1_9HYPO|nr:hypothetical protein NQ176_g3803 [Lecanicillium fungicola]
MGATKDALPQRSHALDNLRSFLTGLVVIHHTAAAYGGAGMRPLFKSGLFAPDFVSLPLWLFDAFVQTFFMGLFFWISGRVSAQSLHRLDTQGQSRRRFVAKRAKRLLLPAIAYTIALNPLVHLFSLPEWDFVAVSQCLAEYFGSVKGIKGPVWYTATLFVFDTLAAAIRLEQPRKHKCVEFKRHYKFLAQWGWVAIAVASFIVRLWYPIGKTLSPLNIQLGYAPQYIFAYCMGHLSFKYGQPTFLGPFSSGHTDPSSKPPLLHVSIASVFVFYLAMLPKLLSGTEQWRKEIMQDVSGGWNMSAVVYAAWNEFSFVLVGPVLVEYFYRWHNEPAASWIWQPRYSYAAFLFHYGVSIPIEQMVDVILLPDRREMPPWYRGSLFKALGPVALTMTVGAANTAASFILGRLIVNSVTGAANVL